MKVEKFVTGIISTNCYLVSNEEYKTGMWSLTRLPVRNS